MARKTFTDESLATLVNETKSYVDSKASTKVDKVNGKDLSTNDYTTAEKTKLAGIETGAEVNQNAFSNVKVGTTTVAADAKTDTIEFVGSNVTITPDATNDKVTFAVADGSTSTAGIVKLTNSTSSTSTTTAATPNSVKSAYDLANTANNAAATAQETADSNKAKLDFTNVSYGTCETAAATAAKVITVSGNTSWKLAEGSMITIKFSATNTAENPTFNVNNTGAKSVWYNTALITTGSLSYAGYANRPSVYMYDGTQYVWLSWAYDANSDTKVTQAAAITTTGEYPVLLGYSTSTSKVTNTVNKTSTLKYNPSTKVLTANSFAGSLSGNADTATTLTGLTATVAELNKLDGVTATTAELNYVDGVTSNIQTQLDGKASNTHTHTASDIGAFGSFPSNYKTDLNEFTELGSFMHTQKLTNGNDVTYGVVWNIRGETSGYMIQYQFDAASKATRKRSYVDGVWSAWALEYDENSIIPISKGGTGSTTRSEAFYNLSYIGDNPITSTTDDTCDNWRTLGNGFCFFSEAGCLNNQPSQWGMLINYTYASEVFQIWHTQPNGNVFYRGGNDNGWSATWSTKFLPLTGGTVNGNITAFASDSSERQFKVTNSLQDGHMCVSTSGNFGLYSASQSKWLIKNTPDGNLELGVLKNTSAIKLNLQAASRVSTDENWYQDIQFASSDGIRTGLIRSQVADNGNRTMQLLVVNSSNSPSGALAVNYNGINDYTYALAPSNNYYSTRQLRNIRANTSAMTAGSSSLTNGEIYLQFE